MEVLSILVLGHFESTESVFFCQGEGVAYRGRVLIELETKMDTQPTKLVEDVLSACFHTTLVQHIYSSDNM